MFPLGKASGCRTMWPTCSSDLSSAWRTTSWRSRFSSSSHTMSRPTIRTCGYGGWRHGKSHEFQGKDPREDRWNRRRWETNRKREEKNIMGKLGDFISKLGISPSFFPTADPSSWCSAMLCFPMGMDGDSQVHGGWLIPSKGIRNDGGMTICQIASLYHGTYALKESFSGDLRMPNMLGMAGHSFPSGVSLKTSWGINPPNQMDAVPCHTIHYRYVYHSSKFMFKL